jgi:hypothetical protein
MKKILFFVVMGTLLILLSDCKKKKDEPQPFASFTANGVSYTYKVASNFGKICILTDYCCTFNATSGETSRNQLTIGLPSDAATGKSYHSADSHFEIVYVSPDGNYYNTYHGSNIDLNITLWEGNGGWAKGTFSGTLLRDTNPTQDSVIITNGQFEAKIYYVEH